MTFKPEKLEEDHFASEYGFLADYTTLRKFWSEANAVLDQTSEPVTTARSKRNRISKIFDCLKAAELSEALLAMWDYQAITIPLDAIGDMAWRDLIGGSLSVLEKRHIPLLGGTDFLDPNDEGDGNPAFIVRNLQWSDYSAFRGFRIFLETDYQENALIALSGGGSTGSKLLSDVRSNFDKQRKINATLADVDPNVEAEALEFTKQFFEKNTANGIKPTYREAEAFLMERLGCTRVRARDLMKLAKSQS